MGQPAGTMYVCVLVDQVDKIPLPKKKLKIPRHNFPLPLAPLVLTKFDIALQFFFGQQKMTWNAFKCQDLHYQTDEEKGITDRDYAYVHGSLEYCIWLYLSTFQTCSAVSR